MNNDEIQVLGTGKRDRKLYNLTMVVVAIVAMVIGAGLYWAFSQDRTEKIKTGEEMGNSTIIAELQHTVDSLLRDKMDSIDAVQGQVIVMDVRTGKILAMVGLERNFEGKLHLCNNFAYQQEAGSLIEPVSMLAVLESGNVTMSDSVFTDYGVWQVDDEYSIKDHNWYRGGYGTLTFSQTLEQSSNIGIVKFVTRAFESNPRQFLSTLDKMSYGQPGNIEGIESLKPAQYSFPKDSTLSYRKIWQRAIGCEGKIAPIQLLTFYNAIANGGKMVKPTLKTGMIEVINPQIASKANIDSMQVVLENVVCLGLGHNARPHFVSVAGKQGTAQVRQYDFWQPNGLNEDPYISLNEYQIGFCGYFPAEAPEYSIIVSMNKLGLPASGSGMAAPVFRSIVEWLCEQDPHRVLIPLNVNGRQQ